VDCRQTCFCDKSLAESAAAAAKKFNFVISGDMCVGNDTSHAGSGLSDLHAAYCPQNPLGFCGMFLGADTVRPAGFTGFIG
jgi:hypothetical protein